MGLFSFVGKALGKVAKAGLSALTHGASDKVLKVLKGTGGTTKNTAFGSNASPAQEQALVAKLTPFKPHVVNTTRVIQAAASGVNTYSGKKRMPGKRKAALSPEAALRREELAFLRTPAGAAYKKQQRVYRAREKRDQGGSGAPRTRRKLSAGMAVMANRMKALAAEWRGLGGQAGTGQTFFEWKRGR